MAIRPRFLPRVRFFKRPTPSHKPFVFDALTETLRNQSQVKPGRFRGLQVLALRDDAQNFDGAPGMPRDYKPAALLLDYTLRWLDTHPGGTTGRNGRGWINESGKLPEYAEIIALHRAQLQSEIDELEAAEAPDTQQSQQLADDYVILNELNKHGFLRAGHDLMGTKCSGLFWGATLAPSLVRSGFTLEKDGSFSLCLQRWEAPTELYEHNFTIEFGNGSTCYALQIGGDGNRSIFYHYRNMTEEQRESLKAQLKEVLDKGRLTVADKRKILRWKEDIQAIRAKHKKEHEVKKEPEQLSEEDSGKIVAIEKQIHDLEDSKRGLSKVDAERVDKLQSDLYLARHEFNLAEDAKQLLGVPVQITFRFLKSGYIAITSSAGRSGKGSWLYENKRITGLNPPRYQSGLPDKCRIALRSDGGKWALVFGHPLHNFIGSAWSQPFTIPFAFDPETVQFEWEADVSFPGCRIDAELVLLKPATTAGGVPLPAQYQVRVDLFSNYNVPADRAGRGTPELYWLEMHIPAGPCANWGAPVWDSENPANWENGTLRRVQDVILRCEDMRGMACDVLISDAGGTANLPFNLGALPCDVHLLDRDNGNAVTPLVSKAMVATAETRRVKSLDGSNGLVVTPDVGHARRIDVVGCENFLTGEIEARLSGHNKYPNDYLRQLALDGGLHPGLILWGAGNIGLPLINKAKPGDYPSCKPAPGVQYLEWMQDVIRNYCPGWALVSKSNGLDLVPLTGNKAIQDRPELAYNLPPVVTISSPLCLRNELHLRQDTRGYVTKVTAVGAVNPLTGMRYVATETLPQASDDRFENSLYFINGDITLTLPFDDSLTSQVACIRRAREELFLRGRPPHFAEPLIDYDATLRPNQQLRVFGIKFIVTAVSFAGLSSGEGDHETMHVEMQINEDRRPN